MKKILIYVAVPFLIGIVETNCRSHKIAARYNEITRCQDEIKEIGKDTVLSKSEVGRILVVNLNRKIDRDQDKLSKLLGKASPKQIIRFSNSIKAKDSVNQDTGKVKTQGKLAKIPSRKTGSDTANQNKSK